MLAQERIYARRHFRVVTVADRVWACELEAEGLPVDWRSVESSHGAFLSVSRPDERLLDGARSMSRALGLGYSSQDWVMSGPGKYVMLDVNPGGQWLFLPSEVSELVTQAVAGWLRGTRGHSQHAAEGAWRGANVLPPDKRPVGRKGGK